MGTNIYQLTDYTYKGVCSSEMKCLWKEHQGFNDVYLYVCVCGCHRDVALTSPLKKEFVIQLQGVQ